MFVNRYVSHRESVRTLVQDIEIRYVGVESPVFGELYSEGMYGLFLYVCEALWERHCDVVFLSNKQTKAHARRFLGRPMKPVKWKMGKADMIEAAKKDTGGKGRWSHDEADAYWAARTAARFWMVFESKIDLDDLTPEERTQFTRIHTFKRGSRAGRTIRSGLIYREDDRFFRWSERE